MKKDTYQSNATEHAIQLGILSFLIARGIYCWRNNSGALPSVYKGRSRLIRFGKEGSADILGLLPNGRFLAIEVKRPNKKPTPAQEVFLEHINRNGGLAFIASSIEDVISHVGTDLE